MAYIGPGTSRVLRLGARRSTSRCCASHASVGHCGRGPWWPGLRGQLQDRSSAYRGHAPSARPGDASPSTGSHKHSVLCDSCTAPTDPSILVGEEGLEPPECLFVGQVILPLIDSPVMFGIAAPARGGLLGRSIAGLHEQSRPCREEDFGGRGESRTRTSGFAGLAWVRARCLAVEATLPRFQGCRRSSCAGVARRETSTALSPPSWVYRARTPHARRLRIASRLWVTLAGLSPPLRRPENGAERGSRTRLASLEGWNLTDRSVPRFVYVRPLGPLASIAANQRTSAPRGARRDSLRPPATTIHRGPVTRG